MNTDPNARLTIPRASAPMPDAARNALMQDLMQLRSLAASPVLTPSGPQEFRTLVQSVGIRLMAHAEELLTCHHVVSNLNRALVPLMASFRIESEAAQTGAPEQGGGQ